MLSLPFSASHKRGLTVEPEVPWIRLISDKIKPLATKVAWVFRHVFYKWRQYLFVIIVRMRFLENCDFWHSYLKYISIKVVPLCGKSHIEFCWWCWDFWLSAGRRPPLWRWVAEFSVCLEDPILGAASSMKQTAPSVGPFLMLVHSVTLEMTLFVLYVFRNDFYEKVVLSLLACQVPPRKLSSPPGFCRIHDYMDAWLVILSCAEL